MQQTKHLEKPSNVIFPLFSKAHSPKGLLISFYHFIGSENLADDGTSFGKLQIRQREEKS